MTINNLENRPNTYVALQQWFSTGDDFAPRGYLAMTEDNKT